MGGFFMLKNFYLISFVLLAGFATACNETAEQRPADATEKPDEPFYPFPQYLQGELAYIDSMPLVVEYTKTVNGKKLDSFYLDKAVFNNQVNDWISEDPNAAGMRDDFKESSFQDLTLNTLTFSITATQPETKLRQADILLNPDTKRVQHVALKRSWAAGDSSVLQSILWVHRMRCLVSEEITRENKTTLRQTHSYVWDRPL